MTLVFEGKSLSEAVDDLWDWILDTQNNFFSLLRNILPFFIEDAKYGFACHLSKLLEICPSVSTSYGRVIMSLHWFSICYCVEHTVCVNVFLKGMYFNMFKKIQTNKRQETWALLWEIP